MDLLAQHEAFLRAIYDTPEDDTPRLVYADFLQEHGDEKRARLIRVQCELALLPGAEMPSGDPEHRFALLTQQALLLAGERDRSWHRGFRILSHVAVDGAELRDIPALRQQIVSRNPEWFGTTSLGVYGRPPLDPVRIEALLDLKAFTRVTRLDLGGYRDEEEDPNSNGILSVIVCEPAISVPGVVALAGHMGMRRIAELILTNNELDNDAARALVKSPYLDSLKRLDLLDGNRFRGKVWQQVIERFGEDVVG
jgi:uncharacterized protein (TIGR02996 family)